MAERTVVAITDFGGLDETFADGDCPPNRLRQAQNVIKASAGVIGKRYGFSPLTTVANASKLSGRSGELVAVDGVNLQAYSSTWRTRGRVPGCIATTTPLDSGADGTGTASIARGGGYVATAWTTASTALLPGLYASVSDTSGSIVVASTRLNTTASVVRLLYISNTIVCVYLNASGILARTFTGTAWSAPTTLVSGTFVSMDAVPTVGGVTFTLVYGTTSAVTVSTWSTSLTSALTATAVATGLPGTTAVSVRATTGEYTFVAFSSYNIGLGTTTWYYAAHNSSNLIQSLAPTALTAGITSLSAGAVGVERLSSTQCLVTMSEARPGFTWATGTVAGATLLATWTNSWSTESKPFVRNGRCYCLAFYNRQYQTTSVLLDLATDLSVAAAPIPMATLNPRASMTGLPVNPDRSFAIDQPGNTTADTYSTLAYAISTQGASSLQMVTFDFAHAGLYQSVPVGASTHYAAGVPFTYDGKRTTEASMLHAPYAFTNTSSSTGGVLQQNAQYKYIFVYEQQNAPGEVSYSPPSSYAPLVVNVGATGTNTNQVQFTVSTLRMSFRQDLQASSAQVNIAVYRTWWNGTNPSDIYYRIGAIRNDPSLSQLSFNDDAALNATDTLIQSNRVLYTTGGVLESDAPPSLYFLCYHNQRVFGLGPDKRTIWYTTPVIQGEQPRWNDYLTIPVQGLGDLTALASIDGKLLVFGASDMAIIYGDGPSDTGAGADFSLPQILPFGVGCTDARSICTMPQGVTFLSDKGLQLFTRAGEVQWIGGRVQRTMSVAPYVTSAVHVERDCQVLFGVSSTLDNTGAGFILCWDYRYDTWTLWTPYATNAGGSFPRLVSMLNVGSTLYALSSTLGGTDILYQDRTTYLDSGRFVPMYVQTPWIKASELGWQRINRLQVSLNKGSAAGLSLECTRDYSQLSGDVTTFSEAAVTASTIPQFDIIPKTQKGEAFSLLITDNAPAVLGTGQGFAVSGVTFQVVVKGTEFKGLPAAQKG